MKNLQLALVLNSVFSMITGFIQVLFPEAIATLFDVAVGLPFRLIGTGLVLFSAMVFL